MTAQASDGTREYEFAVDGPLNLQVRFGYGSVRIIARADARTARVALTAADERSPMLERITVEHRGGTLTVAAPRQGGLPDLIGGWRRERDGVEAVIEVPAGTTTRISTVSAPVTIEGRVGSADVATGAADITIDTVDGDLRLRGGSVHFRVERISGDVVVRSGSGDAHFGDVGGSVSSGFGSGDLDIGAVRGSVRARAGSGNAHLGAVFGDVDLHAGAGRVSVGLPAGVAVRLDVTSGSGRVHSELPVDDAPTPGARSISVRARTGSGEIRLFRAAPVA